MFKAPRPPERNFEQAPPGQYAAVLADVVDIGYQVNDFDKNDISVEPRIRLVFLLSGIDKQGNPIVMEDGRPFVIDDYYKLSLFKPDPLKKSKGQISKLRKTIEAISGPMTDDEAYDWDFEGNIGTPLALTVKQEANAKGVLKSKIENVLEWAPNWPKPPSLDGYVRVQDRREYVPPKWSSLLPPEEAPSLADLRPDGNYYGDQGQAQSNGYEQDEPPHPAGPDENGVIYCNCGLEAQHLSPGNGKPSGFVCGNWYNKQAQKCQYKLRDDEVPSMDQEAPPLEEDDSDPFGA